MADNYHDSSISVQIGLNSSWLSDIAQLYDQAFLAKFERAVPSRLKRLRLWTELINPEAVVGAFRGNDLLGILLFSTPSASGWVRTGATSRVFRILNPWEALKCLAVFALFEKPAPQTELYIEAIAVSDDARGLGIGSLLLQTAKVYATDRGLAGLRLRVIFENSRAKALYEREGFKTILREPSGVMKSVIGIEGADLMELRIGNAGYK